MARASILWLIGEYCERVPKIAPDVLRKMAKSFTTEEDIVKLQIINLAAKLYLTNSKQVQKRYQHQQKGTFRLLLDLWFVVQFGFTQKSTVILNINKSQMRTLALLGQMSERRCDNIKTGIAIVTMLNMDQHQTWHMFLVVLVVHTIT